MTDQRSSIHLSDPRAFRVLAHPTRLRLLGQLRVHGPQTVGMLSDTLDEAVGSVSYHAGKLAEHGFIEPAPELARDGRERWWRAVHASTTWEPLEMLDDPERRSAMDLMRRAVLRCYVDSIEEYLAAEAAMDPAWVRGSASGDTAVHLTADELAELRADLEALAGRWQARSRPEHPDTRAVSMMYFAFRRPR